MNRNEGTEVVTEAPGPAPSGRPGGGEIAVEARGLAKWYDEVAAVAGVDLVVRTGHVHGLVGPNGAGKTTLLAMLLGLVRPDDGTLRLFGRTREEHGQRVLDNVAGFVEAPRFYPYLSARRNLELLAGMDNPGCRPSKEAITDVLELVGLGERGDRKVRGYSVGMRQRLGLAAALLREPRLLVLDEPVSGLDPAGIRDVRALIRRLAAQGTAVLLSSHDMDEVEDLCDDVTIMRAGTAVYQGSMAELRAQAPDPAYRLSTSDDERALALAGGEPDVVVDVHPDGGLLVRARQDRLDAYVVALGRSGVAVRELTLTSSALASLFFRLTEGGEQDQRPGAGTARDDRPSRHALREGVR